MQKTLSFEYVLSNDGLLENQQIEIDEAGTILAVQAFEGKPNDGWMAIPGMVNAHSHSFQRALCGYGEQRLGDDSFWSWRTVMYRLANRVTPDAMRIIAHTAFSEMLAAGYTSVGEFHYLHHLVDGSASSAMADAVIAAAHDSGIDLVLLPVLYQFGGLDKQGHRERLAEQHRFVHRDIDAFLALVTSLRDVDCGFAPHSIRAVDLDQLQAMTEKVRAALGEDIPVHIHISEQTSEVSDCQARYGSTPVETLASRVDLDHRWSLVHATHVTDAESKLISDCGATVVLCPLTEAYLGDGIFPAEAFLDHGGRVAIGSDSNARICATEELRMLEYGQRLASQQRARLSDEHGLGMRLWQHASQAGAVALARDSGSIAPGCRADIVVLDQRKAPLQGPAAIHALDALLIGGSRDCIRDVYVGGQKRVAEGVTASAPDANLFARTVTRLLNDD